MRHHDIALASAAAAALMMMMTAWTAPVQAQQAPWWAPLCPSLEVSVGVQRQSQTWRADRLDRQGPRSTQAPQVSVRQDWFIGLTWELMPWLSAPQRAEVTRDHEVTP